VAASWLAALLLWLAPLLGGSADRPYALAVGALCAVACLLRAARQGAEAPVSFAAVGLLLAQGLSLLQIIPLPPTLRGALAAGSDADLRQILHGITEASAWLPLSVDAASTLNEAASLGGILCLLLAFSVSQAEGTATAATSAWPGALPYRWTVVVMAAAATVAVLGMLSALGLSLPDQVRVPGQGTTRALFPAGLYNSNHMAALCGLGALLALAHLLLPSGRLRAWAMPVAAVTCGLCNLALLGTLSRAGILCWSAAQLVLAVVVSRRQRAVDDAAAPTASSLKWRWLVPLAMVLSWVVLSDGNLARLSQRFSAQELSGLLQPGSKVYAWFDALPILRGHLWFGVGHGAGENILQHSHALSGRMRFAYLENQWLQLIFDFGLLGGVPLLAMLFLFVRDAWGKAVADARRASTDPRSVATWLGLAALAVHNLFDFNLAVLGVALPALTLVFCVEKHRFTWPRWWVVTLSLATLVMVAVAWRFAPSHEEDGAVLRRMASDPSTASDVLVERAQAAMRRHPLDSHIAAVVAARLVMTGDPAARAWLNRALLANPRDTLALRETARLLATQGRADEALLFLRQAIAHGDDEDRGRSLRRLVELAMDADAARSALPSDRDLDALLDIAGGQPQPRWMLIAELSALTLRDGLPATRAAYWLGRSALAGRNPQAALSSLSALLSASDDPPVLLVADLIDFLADQGRLDDAQKWARAALHRRRVPEWLLALARVALRLTPPNLTESRALLSEILSRPSDEAPHTLRARAHELFAELEQVAGNLHSALSHRQTAAALRRQNPTP